MPEEDASPNTDAPADNPTESLGEPGRRALESERVARKLAEKQSATEAKRAADLEDRLSKIDETNKSEHEKALDRARQEATDKVRGEVMAAANERLVKAEVRAAASGKLNDPLDAIRFLDLRDFKVTDDGEVDGKAIDAAVAQLLKDKPYLGAKSSGRPEGDADQGARKGSASTEVAAGRARIAAAYAQSNSNK